MKSRFLITSLSALAVVAGCSKKSDDAVTTTGAFLTPSTFTTVTPTALTKTQVVSEINDEEGLYDNKSSSDDPDAFADTLPDGSLPTGGSSANDPVSQCMKSQSPKAKVIAKETLNIESTVDVVACIKEKYAAQGTPLPSTNGVYKMQYVINVTCPGADLSSLDGKTSAELGFDEGSTGMPAALEEKCKNLPTMKMFMNGSFEASSTTTTAGVATKSGFSMKFGIFTKDGLACELVKDTSGTKSNGCIMASSTETEGPSAAGTSEKNTSLTILESSNIIDLDSPTAQWFNGGSFKVTFNNFTGTVTYTNSTTAPTFQVTAPGNLSASGTVGSSAGALRGGEIPFESVGAHVSQNPLALYRQQQKQFVRGLRSVVR